MGKLLVLCLLSPLAAAEERWIQFSSGPFEVLTDASARAGRETLVRFEEFRHALAQILGDSDLQTPLPVRVLVFKNRLELPRSAEPVLKGRDRFAVLLVAGTPAPPGVFRECTRLFLEANTARMPAHFERGLEDLFSTIEVAGIRITLGSPPPPPERNQEWARMHLLAVDPQYYGKLRVLLFNLRNGVDEEPAYRNAFGKSPGEIEKEAARYLAAGNFQAVEVSPRPLSERDFPEKPVANASVRLALADLLLGDQSRSAYEALIREKLHVPEAYEGLGLLALGAKQPDAARKHFAAAMEAGSQSARCYLEYARLETDDARALAALAQAARLNPKLAEPEFLMGRRESDPARRIQHLKKAATLDPRNADYWQALAQACLAEKDFSEAAKAWRSAEQASTDASERERMRQARLAIEQQRLDWEAAERKRIADEQQRELERLKEQARAEVHALEARVNQGSPPATSGGKVVPWWEGPKATGRAHGILRQVDCLGRRARLVIESDDHKLTKLLVTDPSRVTILGGGEQMLSCGPQKGRRVAVEYFPRPDPKQATVGEVAVIHFQ